MAEQTQTEKSRERIKVIKSIDDYFRIYLPKFDKKYPITMRVSPEEAELLKGRRGQWIYKKK